MKSIAANVAVSTVKNIAAGNSMKLLNENQAARLVVVIRPVM
jgi:hypothetical protein